MRLSPVSHAAACIWSIRPGAEPSMTSIEIRHEWGSSLHRRISVKDSVRSAPQLGGERHRAGAAAGTAHGHQDVLLLILFEIAAIEYLPRLLLEQLMQRKARGRERILDRHVRRVAL